MSAMLERVGSASLRRRGSAARPRRAPPASGGRSRSRRVAVDGARGCRPRRRELFGAEASAASTAPNTTSRSTVFSRAIASTSINNSRFIVTDLHCAPTAFGLLPARRRTGDPLKSEHRLSRASSNFVKAKIQARATPGRPREAPWRGLSGAGLGAVLGVAAGASSWSASLPTRLCARPSRDSAAPSNGCPASGSCPTGKTLVVGRPFFSGGRARGRTSRRLVGAVRPPARTGAGASRASQSSTTITAARGLSPTMRSIVTRSSPPALRSQSTSSNPAGHGAFDDGLPVHGITGSRTPAMTWIGQKWAGRIRPCSFL